MNRMRVWFEQQRVHFPFGDDKTRRTVNILLDELDAHVWKEGEIIDVGRHNDCVMAMAHAIDQFYEWTGQAPMASGSVNMQGWRGKKKPKGLNKGTRPNSRFRVFGG